MSSPSGTVYLLHFERSLADHAQHYLGWAGDLEARLAEHRSGNGARLMAAISDHRIDWELVRTWEGTRALERRLKDQHDARALCPKCREKRREYQKEHRRQASQAPKTRHPDIEIAFADVDEIPF